jgi:hypothetical protein
MDNNKPKHLVRVYKSNEDITKSGWRDVYQGNNFLSALCYFITEKRAQGIDDMVSWTWSGNYED